MEDHNPANPQELNNSKSPDPMKGSKSRPEIANDWFKRFLTPIALNLLFTAVIAISTGVYTIMMYYYTKATYGLLAATTKSNELSQKANELTQQIFYLQNKPYVFISKIDNVNFDREKKVFEMRLPIKNGGNTPAYNVLHCIKILYDNVVQIFPDIVIQGRNESFIQIMWPQKEGFFMFNLKGDVTMGGDQFNLFDESIDRLSFLLTIEYKDIAGVNHRTVEKIYFQSVDDKSVNVITATMEHQ